VDQNTRGHRHIFYSSVEYKSNTKPKIEYFGGILDKPRSSNDIKENWNIYKIVTKHSDINMVTSMTT
jgi:hypothetical protein